MHHFLAGSSLYTARIGLDIQKYSKKRTLTLGMVLITLIWESCIFRNICNECGFVTSYWKKRETAMDFKEIFNLYFQNVCR